MSDSEIQRGKNLQSCSQLITQQFLLLSHNCMTKTAMFSFGYHSQNTWYPQCLDIVMSWHISLQEQNLVRERLVISCSFWLPFEVNIVQTSQTTAESYKNLRQFPILSFRGFNKAKKN